MKKERRQYYRELQASFSEEQYRAWNQALCVHLKSVAAKIPKNSLVAVYQAKPKEADLSCIFSLPLKFCFPKVISRKGQMEFRLVENPKQEEFEAGPYGILEPTHKHRLVTKEEIHTCFVPLLSFDGTGRRLGQGMGFYDRFLEGFSGQKIGVAFEWQFSPADLPIEQYDQHLHMVVTEFGLKKF